MGTPDFAVTILNKLVEEKMDVVAVVTAPDRPAGRGQKINQSAVKMYAVENGLPVLQPEKLKNEEFISELQALNADLFVVVAFRMLPEVVWAMPPKGTINLHGSLLPQYRGAAPINWAVMNGEKTTGVTSFFIEKEIDTGNILLQKEMPIGENMTAGELHDKLALLGAETIVETVRGIASDSLTATPQSNFDLTQIIHAPKIFKEDGRINWKQPVQVVHDFIRGLSPYPAAWTSLTKDGKTYGCKIFQTEKTDLSSSDKTDILLGKEYFLFPTEDFYLKVSSIQIEGKRRMSFKEFQAGNDLTSFKVAE
jgi:methionyl-tRNA formyltransferase